MEHLPAGFFMWAMVGGAWLFAFVFWLLNVLHDLRYPPPPDFEIDADFPGKCASGNTYTMTAVDTTVSTSGTEEPE